LGLIPAALPKQRCVQAKYVRHRISEVLQNLFGDKQIRFGGVEVFLRNAGVRPTERRGRVQSIATIRLHERRMVDGFGIEVLGNWDFRGQTCSQHTVGLENE